MRIFWNSIIFTKKLGQGLSFEGSNVFVEKIGVSFRAVWIGNQCLPWPCDPLILSKMGEICNLAKNQLLTVAEEFLAPQMKDIDLNF